MLFLIAAISLNPSSAAAPILVPAEQVFLHKFDFDENKKPANLSIYLNFEADSMDGSLALVDEDKKTLFKSRSFGEFDSKLLDEWAVQVPRNLYSESVRSATANREKHAYHHFYETQWAMLGRLSPRELLKSNSLPLGVLPGKQGPVEISVRPPKPGTRSVFRDFFVRRMGEPERKYSEFDFSRTLEELGIPGPVTASIGLSSLVSRLEVKIDRAVEVLKTTALRCGKSSVLEVDWEIDEMGKLRSDFIKSIAVPQGARLEEKWQFQFVSGVHAKHGKVSATLLRHSISDVTGESPKMIFLELHFPTHLLVEPISSFPGLGSLAQWYSGPFGGEKNFQQGLATQLKDKFKIDDVEFRPVRDCGKVRSATI